MNYLFCFIAGGAVVSAYWQWPWVKKQWAWVKKKAGDLKDWLGRL